METTAFHHALKIDEDICIGCSHCMNICPTEAIRMRAGKAILNGNRCVDCGECYKVCPVNAIFIEQDDFQEIFNYTYRVALLPAIFFAQFSSLIPLSRKYHALQQAGFTHVYEVESSVELLLDQTNEYITSHPDKSPVISSFCPAILRLIQVRFPSLVGNIALLKPPLDITAMYCKNELMDQGVEKEEIGLFYITPCAAKIAAIKSPVGEEHSLIDGVINMDMLYNKVSRILHQNREDAKDPIKPRRLSNKALLYSLTRGEAEHMKGRSLAIDEIHNVIEFLEKVENDELPDVSFLELRACDESCAGGVLVSGNRFLAGERLRGGINQLNSVEESGKEHGIDNYSDYLTSNISIQEIKPRSIVKLDEDMVRAMVKMAHIEQIMKRLPSTDCGICGAPTCRAFAEDIVRGEAVVEQCIFILKEKEFNGEISIAESKKMVESIWGKFKSNI